MFLSSAKRIPGRSPRATIFFLILFHFLATWAAHAQSETPQTGDGSRQAASDSQAAEALRGLAEKNALTVRALIGYGRIPSSAMAPLSGLRAKGIDVLGASPEQLDAILKEHNDTLSAAEKQALGKVSAIMRETGKTAAGGAGTAQPEHENGIAVSVAEPPTTAPAQDEGIAVSVAEAPVHATGTSVPVRPAPAPLPPMPLPPALPMAELGSAQYAGMVTTAKEATRTLMGTISEAETQKFEERWAAYYDHPSAEIVDHFRAATPILSEFLNIREAIATTSAAFDQAWSEARMAAEYDNLDAADATLAQADMLKDYLVSLEARGRQLAQALQDLGEIPDPVAAKEEARSRHKSAIEAVKELFVDAPPLEGIWYGSSEYDEDGWIKDIKGSPILFVVYAVGDPANPSYRALRLDAETYDEKTDPFVNIFGLNDGDTPDMPGMLNAFGDGTLRHSYEMKDEEDTYVITVSAERLGDDADSFEYPPPVALDTVEAAFEKERKQNTEKREQLESAPSAPSETTEQALKQSAQQVVGVAMVSIFEKFAVSAMNDVRRHNEWTPVFLQAARQWLKERPFSAGTTLAQDRQAMSAMFARLLGPQQAPPQPAQTMVAQVTEKAAEPEPQQAVDEATEAERVARLERIEFHKQNMIIIQRNLDRDREDLAKETDPDRRAQLEFRIVGAMSDLQGEKDLVASIETGELVRTRSAFDDYAHAGFIANIQQSQRQMERFQRSSDALFKLAGMLPGSEGGEARAFVERQLTPEVRLNMDQAAVKRIAEALGKKVEGHYLGEQAKSDEDAAYATLGLEAAENIKSAADSSMMVLSLFGGQYVDAAYQAATGYVEGGMEEAVLRTASMFGPTAGAAAEAMRGYREGGVEGALKSGVISFVTSKGMEYGMGKVLGKAKNADGPDAPPVKKGVDAPDAPASKSAPAGQHNLSALPSSADQRALEHFKQARKQGENLAEDFRQAQKRLADAGAAGAPAEEIMRLQAEVREKVAQVNGSPHAKNFLKYKGDAGSQQAFNAHLRAVHADVEAKFHANMQANGWNQPPLKEFRNAASSGSVGMDFDIGLDQQMARSISRDGKPAKINEWQKDAQKAWNDAYKASTGLEAEQAWETITTHAHAESYKDMAWLSKDKSGVSKVWGQQAADVTRYKSWHMMNDASLDRMTKLQEISRGAAKDMQTKLGPILDQVKPTGKSLAKFQNAREHWNKVRQILTDFGDNTIDPITADRRIRELTGGKSIPDVVEDMTYLLEGAVKFGNRS